MSKNNKTNMVRKIIKNKNSDRSTHYKKEAIGLELNLMDKYGNLLSVGDDIKYGDYIGVLLYNRAYKRYGVFLSNSLCYFGDKYNADSYWKFVEIPMDNGARMEIEKL